MIRTLESTLDDKDIQKSGFEIVKIGDKVSFPIRSEMEIPNIGDIFRIGPLVGTCVDIKDDKVIMEVDWNTYATKGINEALPSGRSESEFLDKYFGRVDLSDKNRYKYYKYRGKEFAYDTKNSEVCYLFKDEDEIAEIGNKAPYRSMDEVGLSWEHWRDRETRNEYLDGYIDGLERYANDIAADFVKNELPNYQKESITLNDIENAKYSSSFMNDRATINIDGREYVKIGKNKWQHNPSQSRALGATYTDKDIFELAVKGTTKFTEANEIDFTDDIEDLEINEYVISYQYTPDEDNSMTGELTIMATSMDEAEEEFYKYHNGDYYILEITRQNIDNESGDTAEDEVVADQEIEIDNDETLEAVGVSADGIDPNQTGTVEPAGNNQEDMSDEIAAAAQEIADKSEESAEPEDFRSDNADEDDEILMELDEDNASFPEWTYTEDEIFDVAYQLMNNGYLPGWEAADIQDELLYADHQIIGDAPYLFTMEEEDIYDEEDEDLDESFDMSGEFLPDDYDEEVIIDEGRSVATGRWTYSVDDISDVAYDIMNMGYCEGMEAADIEDELMFADNKTIGDAPFKFTMIEDD